MSQYDWDRFKYRGIIDSESGTQLKKKMSQEGPMVYFDMTAVAPPPSRDYFHLKVTDQWVHLTHWEITHGHGSRSGSVPHESKVELHNFRTNKDMMSQIGRIFGQSYLEYIVGLSKGQIDWIFSLDDKTLIKIISYVGLENLSTVAPVCTRFNRLCQSDELWRKFYKQYAGVDKYLETASQQAPLFSWKNLFLLNRVHDNMFNGIKVRLGSQFSERNMETRLKDIKLVSEGEGDEALLKDN